MSHLRDQEVFLLSKILPHGREKIIRETSRNEACILHILYRETFTAKFLHEFTFAVQMVEARHVEVLLSPADIDIAKLVRSNEELLGKIKEKKELSQLSDSFILDVLGKHLSKINTEKLKPSEKKIIVKEVRAELRRSAGMFQKGFKSRESILEKGDVQSLLKTHSSTAERMDFYLELKKIYHKLLIANLKIRESYNDPVLVLDLVLSEICNR